MSFAAEIFIDLGAVERDNSVRTVRQGSDDWTLKLRDELRGMPSFEVDSLQVDVDGIPRPASSKSIMIGALAGIALGVTTLSVVDVKTTKKVFDSIWHILKKHLAKGTKVRLSAGKSTVEISTDDKATALALMEASLQLAESLRVSGGAQSRKKRSVTLTPLKR